MRIECYRIFVSIGDSRLEVGDWKSDFQSPTSNLEFPIELKVAAGLEIEAVGAHELAFLLIELCPAIRAGAFDLLDLGRITGAGRHAVCRLGFLCRSTPQDDRGSLPHPRAVPQTW